MIDAIKTHVIAQLQGARMMSVENLAAAVELAPSDLLPILDVLQQEGAVRQGGSVCRPSCKSCAVDSCATPQPGWQKGSIVISLLKEAEL